MIWPSVENNCAGTEVHPFTDMHPSGDMNAGGESGEVLNDHIMTDRTSNIDLDMSTDPHIDRYNAAGADDATGSNRHGFRALYMRVHERYWPKTSMLDAGREPLTVCGVADAYDITGARKLADRGIRPHHRYAVQPVAVASGIVVDERGHAVRPLRAAVALCEPRSLTSRSARAINDQVVHVFSVTPGSGEYMESGMASTTAPFLFVSLPSRARAS